MIKLQILGTGCAKCHKLSDETRAAADGLGLQYTLEKVTNIQDIMKFSVMMTPALVIDGVVKVAGRIPSREEIATWLSTAAEKARA